MRIYKNLFVYKKSVNKIFTVKNYMTEKLYEIPYCADLKLNKP